MEKLMEEIPHTFVWSWLAVFAVVIILLVKFGPKVWKWLKVIHEEMKKKETIDEKIKKHESEIQNINKKLDRDYQTLNEMKRLNKEQAKRIDDSMEEREIIMKSLLGIIKGLQELGTNGPTKEAQHEIENYMLKKSHEVERTE